MLKHFLLASLFKKIDIIVCTFIYVHVRQVQDPEKDAINRAEHGVSFETAALVFDDPFHLSVIDRVVDGEERFRTIGQIGGLLISGCRP